MIRRLTLKNWRNYEDVTFNLGPGTTFVVASNGVGKTSLVEAARWALFGIGVKDSSSAIRIGAASAQAIVDLELPDLKILTIERMLINKRGAVHAPPTVRLDGALVPHEDLAAHLISAYGTEPGFLSGLTMPAINRENDRPSSLGLEDHLGRYYGIDGLRNALDELKAMRKDNDSRIKRIKATNAASSKRLEELQSRLDEAVRQVEATSDAHREIQVRADKMRERQRLEASLQEWQAAYLSWTKAVETMTTRISAEFGRLVSVENIAVAIDERLGQLDRQVDETQVEIARYRAKDEALTTNEERLNAAHDDCPVCRRPLDDNAITVAHETNLRDLVTIRDSILELESTKSSLRAQRDRVKAVQAEWQNLRHPGKPPQVPATDAENVTVAEIEVMKTQAFDALVNARATHLQTKNELENSRSANEAMRELESLFKRDASLRITIETSESTLRELLDKTIRPLATEVGQRWKALFPDRGDIDTYADGSITRNINGHSLPYDSFSTGESMGATLLLRILVLQMATKADFCWFDEPLEHLDPDVRRKVANLLSRVASAHGPLRQVVVTTYEEPLARKLHARDEQQVTLVDVRHAG